MEKKVCHSIPTKQEVLAAYNKGVPDVIKPNLKVLFCGINPGLYTATVQHHFGRPGNRFWKALYTGGFTSELLIPCEVSRLPEFGYGITNLVDRATLLASELSKEELVEGRKILEHKIKKYKPEWVAILGVDSYRKAFDKTKAKVGQQEGTINETKIWVLPNPSGLNAHFTPDKLTKIFKAFRRAIC